MDLPNLPNLIIRYKTFYKGYGGMHLCRCYSQFWQSIKNVRRGWRGWAAGGVALAQFTPCAGPAKGRQRVRGVGRKLPPPGNQNPYFGPRCGARRARIAKVALSSVAPEGFKS
jgi:hypothetical protein